MPRVCLAITHDSFAAGSDNLSVRDVGKANTV